MIPGSILHYRIERKLGKGGMGAVFLATDTRLDRKVAIKFLSTDYDADPGIPDLEDAKMRLAHLKAQVG